MATGTISIPRQTLLKSISLPSVSFHFRHRLAGSSLGSTLFRCTGRRYGPFSIGNFPTSRLDLPTILFCGAGSSGILTSVAKSHQFCLHLTVPTFVSR